MNPAKLADLEASTRALLVAARDMDEPTAVHRRRVLASVERLTNAWLPPAHGVTGQGPANDRSR